MLRVPTEGMASKYLQPVGAVPSRPSWVQAADLDVEDLPGV